MGAMGPGFVKARDAIASGHLLPVRTWLKLKKNDKF